MSGIYRADLFVILFLLILALTALLVRVIPMIKGTLQPSKSAAICWLSTGGLWLIATPIGLYQSCIWVPQLLYALIFLGLGAFEWKRYKDVNG